VVDAAADVRFKLEMPAAQLELSLPPARTVPEAIAALARARRDLAAAAAPVGRLAAAGVHPFADRSGASTRAGATR
jgi:carboxylate-amine ligase